MEVVALVYMPKNCAYMPEPSSGDHYMLLHLTGDTNICIGALSTFMAAKLTVASKHGHSGMDMQLKLPPNFSLQLEGSDLIDERARSYGPIWKNEELVICGDDNQPLTINGETAVMESPIKFTPIDQFMPLQCLALTSIGYKPKYMNDAFTFKETVTEMWHPQVSLHNIRRTPLGGPGAECDPTCLCEVLVLMTNSLEHLEDEYFSCFNTTVQATREVLAGLNEVDVTYIDTVLEDLACHSDPCCDRHVNR